MGNGMLGADRSIRNCPSSSSSSSSSSFTPSVLFANNVPHKKAEKPNTVQGFMKSRVQFHFFILKKFETDTKMIGFSTKRVELFYEVRSMPSSKRIAAWKRRKGTVFCLCCRKGGRQEISIPPPPLLPPPKAHFPTLPLEVLRVAMLAFLLPPPPGLRAKN